MKLEVARVPLTSSAYGDCVAAPSACAPPACLGAGPFQSLKSHTRALAQRAGQALVGQWSVLLSTGRLPVSSAMASWHLLKVRECCWVAVIAVIATFAPCRRAELLLAQCTERDSRWQVFSGVWQCQAAAGLPVGE